MKILLSILGLCYALSPYDLLPDFLVGLGWVDDVILLFLLWKYFYAPVKKQFGYAGAYHQYRRTDQRDNRKRTDTNGPSGSGSNDDGKRRRKDPWRILGVGGNASPEQIKGAYRGLAMKYHPDRVMHLGEEFRALADERFKEIQRAYVELKPK